MLFRSLFFFEFRSKKADCRATFTFAAAGLGMGGDLGGGVAPAPSDILHNRQPNLWSDLACECYFSANDFDWTIGQIFLGTMTFAYGCGVVRISAGLFPVLFKPQNCSGWGTGVGAGFGAFTGMWKQLGPSRTYW